MKTPYEYLKELSEPTPNWLEKFKDGDEFNHADFFNSRIVYYPGSGTDGHPVKLFGSTHGAHCYVYADYGKTQSDLESEIDDSLHGFQGYFTLARIQLTEKDLAPNGWSSHVSSNEVSPNATNYANTTPFCFLEILEREKILDDSHGASRLAILFLGADGIASYDALFCQKDNINSPFAVVLQDHGFGGNYDRFEEGGLLSRIANRCNVLPKFLLAAEGTKPWKGFSKVLNVAGDNGGMHNLRRFLYE